MKVLLKWLITYIPAIIFSIISVGLSAGIGVMMALGSTTGHIDDKYSSVVLPLVFGVFLLPLLFLCLSTLIFIKITNKANISSAKKWCLAFFWIPLLIIYYLVLLAPSLLIWLVIIIVISAGLTFVRKLISSGLKKTR